MPRLRHIAVVAALAGFAAQSAYAQEVYVEGPIDSEVYDEAPALVYDEGAEIIDGPRVYGFVAVRPRNCGTYKYWDGTACLDARDKELDKLP